MKHFQLDRRLKRAHIVFDGMGFDAAESGLLTRSLQYVMATVMRTEYPEKKARKLIPVNHEVPSGAQSFSWSLYDIFGKADVINPGSDDFPMVSTATRETLQAIKSIGIGYGYDVHQLRAAALGQFPLDARLAIAVREIFENAVDYIAAKGNTAAGLPGFVNNAAVTVIAGGAELVGAWLTGPKTPAQILSDLNIIANYIAKNTNEIYAANAMVLPIELYQYIQETPWSTTGNGESILTLFLRNQTYVKDVSSWSPLSTADVAGTGNRIVAYRRDPRTLELVIPQEFEQFAPQLQNLKACVPCHGRIAGTTIYQPGAVVYADGC